MHKGGKSSKTMKKNEGSAQWVVTGWRLQTLRGKKTRAGKVNTGGENVVEGHERAKDLRKVDALGRATKQRYYRKTWGGSSEKQIKGGLIKFKKHGSAYIRGRIHALRIHGKSGGEITS